VEEKKEEDNGACSDIYILNKLYSSSQDKIPGSNCSTRHGQSAETFAAIQTLVDFVLASCFFLVFIDVAQPRTFFFDYYYYYFLAP